LQIRNQLLVIFDVEGVLYDEEYLPLLAEKLDKEEEIWEITKQGIQGSKDSLKDYWGYKVKERGSLLSLLTSWDGKILLTSRKGKMFNKESSKWIFDSTDTILVVFGSPERGLHEILGGKLNEIQNSKIMNFFPNQATDTVRLEEAIIGILSILNIFRTS